MTFRKKEGHAAVSSGKALPYYFQIHLRHLLAPFPFWRPLIPLSVALRFIHVSQNEKFAAHLGAFSSGNSITRSCCVRESLAF